METKTEETKTENVCIQTGSSPEDLRYWLMLEYAIEIGKDPFKYPPKRKPRHSKGSEEII